MAVGYRIPSGYDLTCPQPARVGLWRKAIYSFTYNPARAKLIRINQHIFMVTATNFATKNPNLPANIYPSLINGSGAILFGEFDTLATPPAGSSYTGVFQKGCILLKTDAADTVGAEYQNTGTLAVPAWTLMPIT